jgi:hypothetical protein
VYLSFASFESTPSFFSTTLSFLLLELLLSGQQRLRCIRYRIPVPRVISFGLAAPSMYSRQDFGPSSYLFRASSAFDVFETGFRSLELSLSGQQRLRCIRDRIPVPRVISFGPAAPSMYSRQYFGPSSYLFRASSAFDVFEIGLRSLELYFRASSVFETSEAGFSSLGLSLLG